MKPSWRSILETALKHLAAAGIDEPRSDARRLLQHAGGVDHARLISLWSTECPSEVAGRFQHFVERRSRGEPVSRIVGRREFFGLDFEVSPDVLDPRADTELLVEMAIRELAGSDTATAIRFCDIGTGSGAVAVALLKQLPNATCVAVDVSHQALEVALRNAMRHGVGDRIEFCHGNYLEPLQGSFDLLVSNPPYIASHEIESLSREVREHDPALALDGGKDGLDAYRAILGGARQVLKPDGLILLEIGHDQPQSVSAIAADCGFDNIVVHKDMAGHDRVITARLD
ncbi:MAG: peptide chain release factor N(5)-glutamine methyltransferase [Nitratireductor sp.]